RAARDVDQKRRALHQPEPAGIDQPLGLGAKRGADRHRVAERQHLVELGKRIDPLDTVAGFARAAIGGEYSAPEHGGAPCHFLADAAEPDDAERAAADLAMRRAAMNPAWP